MQRWQGLGEVPAGWGPSVVTIGVFDGVHRGHQRIVAEAAAAAAAAGRPVVVVTFDPHPDEVIRPRSHPPFLCSVRRRGELLAGLGVTAVCMLPFTYEFSSSADEFVRAVLVDRLHATPRDRGGGLPLRPPRRRRRGPPGRAGREVRLHGRGSAAADRRRPDHLLDRDPARLSDGDVAGAARDLGRPQRVEGVVVRGHRRGRALGFPTANLETLPHTAIPADGVYAGWLVSLGPDGAEQERWPAAVSIGTNPTFDGLEQTVEAYALDRDDLDLYGRHMAADFVTLIRGQARFDSVPELVEQMGRDVAAARAELAGGPR